MCGIAAIVDHNVPEELKRSCLESLNRRGPDSGGEWSSASARVWLGHRRLSIVDLSEAGNQPMHNEDDSIWLVCNGEIYNYQMLRNRLEGLGHRFYSNSDNEAIIHAYEQWGEDLLHELEGMFAFALWDEKKRKLLAARDRVGIKPLYYSCSGGRLAVASSAGALLHLLADRPDLDSTAIAYVMTLGYIPSPYSIWNGISKLEPGHYIELHSEQGMRVHKYWEPPREIVPDSRHHDDEWPEFFKEVLSEHLLSDVPVGLFLSSGLDSTSIAAGLREMDRPVQTLTVSFPGSEFDEAPTAETTAQHLRLPHRRIPLGVGDVNRLAHRVAKTFDEPQGYSALLSMYLISEVSARDFKVVLAGDGGDEVFGGYTWYNSLNGEYGILNRFRRKMLRARMRGASSPGLSRRAGDAFENSSILHRHAWRLFPRFLPEEAEAILSPTGVRFTDADMLAPLKKHYEPALPLKRALQRVDLMTFCSDSILAKVDRASMAHSLEVRVPFLDRRVVERYLTVPLRPREAEQNKPLLREYLRTRVPSEVLSAPKQGFSLQCMENFDREAAREAIRNGPLVKRGYFHRDWDRSLEPGVPYCGARIWILFMLTCWADAWLS